MRSRKNKLMKLDYQKKIQYHIVQSVLNLPTYYIHPNQIPFYKDHFTCHQCTHFFSNHPNYFCPIHFLKGLFLCIPNFCSLRCASLFFKKHFGSLKHWLCLWYLKNYLGLHPAEPPYPPSSSHHSTWSVSLTPPLWPPGEPMRSQTPGSPPIVNHPPNLKGVEDGWAADLQARSPHEPSCDEVPAHSS